MEGRKLHAPWRGSRRGRALVRGPARVALLATTLAAGSCLSGGSDWEARLAGAADAVVTVDEEILPFGLWLPVRARAERIAPLRVAYELSLAGDVNGALALVAALRREHPEAPELLAARAALLRLAGYLRASERALTEAVAAAPEELPLVLGLAELRLELGMPTAAIQALTEAQARGHEGAELQRGLGVAWGRLGRTAEARRAFDRAFALDSPDAVELYLEAARVLREPACRNRSGPEDLAWVDAVLQRAVELAPSDARAWLTRGLFLERTGRVDEALVAYEQACAAEPWSRRAWTHLALAARAAQDRERLGRALEQALALDGDARRSRRLARLTEGLEPVLADGR